MTFSVPSFLAAATRLLIPPNAATDAAFDADAVVVAELELLEPLLPQPARTISPLTAAALAIVFPLRPCASSDLRNHHSPGRGRGIDGGIVAGQIGRQVAVARQIT